MNCNLFKKKYKKYVAFIFFCLYKGVCYGFALVAELVDAADLKSVEGNLVPVRFRPSAPFILLENQALKSRAKAEKLGSLIFLNP